MATKKTPAPVKNAKKAAPAKKVAKKAVAKKPAAAKRTRVKKTVGAAPVPTTATLGKEGAFHVIAEFNDEVIEGNTDNIGEAVANLKPAKLNTKLVLKFSLSAAPDTKKNPRKVVEKVLMIPMARRIFVNDMAGLLLAKSVKLALGYNDEDSK